MDKPIILKREANPYTVEQKLRVLATCLAELAECTVHEHWEDDLKQSLHALAHVAEEAWEEIASLVNGGPIKEQPEEPKPRRGKASRPRPPRGPGSPEAPGREGPLGPLPPDLVNLGEGPTA